MKKSARLWGDYYLSYNTVFCSFFLISQFRQTHIWGLNDAWSKTLNVPLKTTDKS